MKKFIVGLALLLSALVCSAQTLWGGTATGMSPNDVRQVQPSAAPPGADGNRIASGALELLRIPVVEIEDAKFTVQFYFLNNKLTQVMLSLHKPATLREVRSVFDRLDTLLRAKYGTEIKSDKKESASAKFYDKTWISGRTNILLTAISIGDGNDSILNVVYQTRIAEEASKL
jgi:hypothetical protein